jgi:archaellum component FlaG (FlaF/FlaG flagellin family)
MVYSFDDVVYSSSLIMFVVALICVFAYEFFSLKTTKTVTKESSISDSSSKKGKKYKKQSDKFA